MQYNSNPKGMYSVQLNPLKAPQKPTTQPSRTDPRSAEIRKKFHSTVPNRLAVRRKAKKKHSIQQYSTGICCCCCCCCCCVWRDSELKYVIICFTIHIIVLRNCLISLDRLFTGIVPTNSEPDSKFSIDEFCR